MATVGTVWGVIRSETEGLLQPICESNDSICRLQNPPDCVVEPCLASLTIFIFPFLALFIGTLAHRVAELAKVQYTLVLLFAGVVLGALGCGVDLGLLSTSLRQWVHLNPPEIFFFVFLAPLVFEAAFKTQWHVFRRVLVPVFTLAFVIVIIQVFLIAAFQRLVIRTPDWTWFAALMFGAMLSATDPISVTATLTSVGASEVLGTLIEGESLFNDGSAFVLFEAFFENTVEPNSLTNGEIVRDIFKLSIGGALMGVAFALGALIVLSLVYDEFEVETSVTVIIAFLGFWTAQSPSRLSGVICNVVSGLILSGFGRPFISPSVRSPLSKFWELIAWIANTIVFVHAGVLVSGFVWSCSGDPHAWFDYVFIFVYFAFLQVVRIGLILIFKPILRIENSWFNLKEALVVGASGLRGAVSLILALEVGSTPAVPINVRGRVVLWTTGIVFLSLLINGLLIKPIVHYFGLDRADAVQEDFLRRGRSLVIQRTLVILDIMAIEGSLKLSRWSYVAKHVLPGEWLKEQVDKPGYAEALAQYDTSGRIRTRGGSLDLNLDEGRKHREINDLSRRLSTDLTRRVSMAEAPSPSLPSTPVLATFQPGGLGRQLPQVLMRKGGGAPSSSGFRTPRMSDFDELQDNSLHLGLPAVPASRRQVGSSPSVVPASPERHHLSTRLSIDVDRERYAPKKSQLDVREGLARHHSELARFTAAHANAAEQTERTAEATCDEETREALHEKKKLEKLEIREIRRRMLVNMLSQLRVLAHATLSEIPVLITLDGDIQEAIDANEEDEPYDLYTLLHHKAWYRRLFHKFLDMLPEVSILPLHGEALIVKAHVVIAIITHVLKEKFIKQSPVVYAEAELLYEEAVKLLHGLEAFNPLAGAWVESQFAISLIHARQEQVIRDLLLEGTLDENEHKVLQSELLELQRNHKLKSGKRKELRQVISNRDALLNHPLFATLDPATRSRIWRSGSGSGLGALQHLRGGQRLQSNPGDLIVVLKGALRPVLDERIHDHGLANDTDEEDKVHRAAHEQGHLQFQSGGTMHWCFSAHNAFCGADVTLLANQRADGISVEMAMENVKFANRFRACEISGEASVWTLAEQEVFNLAAKNPHFMTEMTRCLARQMVLESVSDLPPYSLSHFDEALSNVHDENTLIGRATKILERLPYMQVVPLVDCPPGGNPTSSSADKLPDVKRAAEAGVGFIVQGPGVLLHGRVQVSIAANNLGVDGDHGFSILHQELVGPALLPAGKLIIEAQHGTGPSAASVGEYGASESSTLRAQALAAEAEAVIGDKDDNICEKGIVFGHVLVEVVGDLDRLGFERLARWTAQPETVDQNGRFGLLRDISVESVQTASVLHSLYKPKGSVPSVPPGAEGPETQNPGQTNAVGSAARTSGSGSDAEEGTDGSQKVTVPDTAELGSTDEESSDLTADAQVVEMASKSAREHGASSADVSKEER